MTDNVYKKDYYIWQVRAHVPDLFFTRTKSIARAKSIINFIRINNMDHVYYISMTKEKAKKDNCKLFNIITLVALKEKDAFLFKMKFPKMEYDILKHTNEEFSSLHASITNDFNNKKPVYNLSCRNMTRQIYNHRHAISYDKDWVLKI